MIIYNGTSSLLDPKVVSKLRFGHAAKFLAPLAPLIKLGMATSRKGKTAMGRAMSHILCVAMNKEFPRLDIDPSEVRISEGSLQNPINVQVHRQEHMLDITWDMPVRQLEDHTDDTVIVCAYDVYGRVAFRNEPGVERRDVSTRIELSDDKADVSVHLYMMCHNRERTKFSRSRYLGCF